MQARLLLYPVADIDAALPFFTQGLGLAVKFRDGDRYCDVYARWAKVSGPLMGSLLRPFPPVRDAMSLLAAARLSGTAELARLAVLSLRRMMEEEFRGDAARVVFSLSTVDGFAFDPEVLMIGRALGLTVTEVPVDWTAVEGSSVRPLRDSFVTGVTLLRVVWQVRPPRIRDRARRLGWSPASSAGPP